MESRHRVQIRDPNRKGYYPTLVEITANHWNWHEIERSDWKGNGFCIRPVLVENYISRVTLGQDVALPTYNQTVVKRPQFDNIGDEIRAYCAEMGIEVPDEFKNLEGAM